MKKAIKNTAVILLTMCLFITSCLGYNLSYWDAYNNQYYPTDDGACFKIPLVSKITDAEDTNALNIVNTAVVTGDGKWNTANFLPFSLSHLYSSSSSSYSVEVIAGCLSYVQSFFDVHDEIGGQTVWGYLDAQDAYYGGTHKSIGLYSSTSENMYPMTRIGIVINSSLSAAQYAIVAAHELGHALGWYGHSVSTNQIMHYTANNKAQSTIGTQDKRHIKQFYDLFYN